MERLKSIFAAHPSPASDAGDAAHALVSAAVECSQVATACADACLEGPDPAKTRTCIRMNQDCADISASTARLISRPGKQHRAVLRAQLETCATACRTNADACEEHADEMEHCAISAKASRVCAEACDTMIAALV